MGMKYKKYIAYIALILTIVGMLFISVPRLKPFILSLYFETKYDEETRTVHAYLPVLLKSDDVVLGAIITKDCRLQRPEYLAMVRRELGNIDLGSARISFARRVMDNGVDRFFVAIYSKSNPETRVMIQLVNNSGKWLIRSIFFEKENH